MTRLVIVHSLGLGLEPDLPEVHSQVKRVGTAIKWSSSRKWGAGLGRQPILCVTIHAIFIVTWSCAYDAVLVSDGMYI